MNYFNQNTEEPSTGNVLNFTAPRLSYKGTGFVSLDKLHTRFTKKSLHFNKQMETLQVKSLEDILGFELKGLRNVIEQFPPEYRWYNPNPLCWTDPSRNETDMRKVYHWWMDCVYVLAQTVPDIAKMFFENINMYKKTDKEFLKKGCRERISKVNAKKERKFKNGEYYKEEHHDIASKIQGQLISNHLWGVIKDNLGIQYVNHHWFNVDFLEHLLVGHLISEVMIPFLAPTMFERDCLFKDYKDTDMDRESFKQVGDLATIFGVITVLRPILSKEDIEGHITNPKMKKYFSKENLKILDNCLEAFEKKLPRVEVPEKETTD